MDGICISSMSHPKAPWWRRWLIRFRRINPESLVKMELDDEKLSNGVPFLWAPLKGATEPLAAAFAAAEEIKGTNLWQHGQSDTEIEGIILDHLLPDDAPHALKILAVCFAWVAVGSGTIDEHTLDYVKTAIKRLRDETGKDEVLG